MDELRENLTPILRKYAIPLSLGIFGMMFLGYGLIQSFPTKANEDLIYTANSENSQAVKSANTISEITVDVSGAVVDPGVYVLPEGSRVKDALEKAGGLDESADSEFVERSFNLAAKLVDGSKLYIPTVGESIGSTATNTSDAQVQSGINIPGSQAGALLNINTASVSELDTLSGVGPVTAGKIINSRPYSAIEELLSKKVVSSTVFEKIKEHIAVY